MNLEETRWSFETDSVSHIIMHHVLEQLGSDALLLFATDYPHWHFDGSDALPPGLPPAVAQKIVLDNPLATYPRLRETVS